MTRCNYIRERIDEADKPDVLSFEVNEHIGRCAECERFASERAGLRELLASGPRVAAPLNFDAMLNSRLAEMKSRRGFSWLSPAGLMRLGAATAGLVVMAFAAQYAGLFSDKTIHETDRRAEFVQPTPGDDAAQAPNLSPPGLGTNTDRGLGGDVTLSSVEPRTQKNIRGLIGGRRIPVPVDYSSLDDGGVVLLRGQNGSADVPMPTVSVGAQPLLYVSAGQRPVRSTGTSF